MASRHPGEYLFETSDGQRGTTRLSTRGVYVERGHNVAHVAIELESSGRAGMQLDTSALRLEVFEGNETSSEMRPSSTTGSTQIPARGYGRLDAYFELPAGMKPSEVTGLAVTWAAQMGDERRGEVTRFEGFKQPRVHGTPISYGPFMPGSGAISPTGEWYACPEDPYYFYPYPPDCL